jgi:hypothetical protein
MNKTAINPDPRATRAVCRLLAAIDNALPRCAKSRRQKCDSIVKHSACAAVCALLPSQPTPRSRCAMNETINASRATFGVPDVCERYRVSEATVLHWIHSGQLRALNVGRTPGARRPRWRITAQALEEFEAARSAAPPAPRQRRRRQRDDVIEFYR